MRAQLSKRAHEHVLRTIVPYRRLDLRDSRVRKFRTREKYLKNTEKNRIYSWGQRWVGRGRVIVAHVPGNLPRNVRPYERTFVFGESCRFTTDRFMSLFSAFGPSEWCIAVIRDTNRLFRLKTLPFFGEKFAVCVGGEQPFWWVGRFSDCLRAAMIKKN